MKHLCSLIGAVTLLAGGAFLLVRLVHSDEMSMRLIAVVVALVVIGSFVLWECLIGRHKRS